MPLSLRSLRIEPPVIMAPMCGCTDLSFRRILRGFGCALAFTEMVKDRAVISGNRKTDELLATEEGDRPLGAQLAGRDPALLAEAARRLEQRGASVIDLNAGCPVPKVVRDGCGSALLRDPALVGRIVERMAAAVQVPVTVKMRTGFESGDEGRFLEIARLAESAGAAALTVHGRSRDQGFAGEANLEAIRRVKALVRIPVIGNGNLRRGPDAARMMRETGCDGVMVARGALGNPWIFREIRAALAGEPEPPPPGIPERAAVLAMHFDGLCALYGVERAIRRVRKVIQWFVKGVAGSTDLRNEGCRLATEAQFREFVARFAASRSQADVRGGIPSCA
jgi:tRNA-dihydrouridine synthase B